MRAFLNLRQPDAGSASETRVLGQLLSGVGLNFNLTSDHWLLGPNNSSQVALV